MTVRIAAVLGSLREGSFNRRLLCGPATALLHKLGAEVELVDLRRLVLPIYDEDLDPKSIPAVAELSAICERANGFLFASPEYNYGIPGGLKNALDWISHPPPGPLANKPAALMGVSTGRLATAHTQAALRTVLAYLGVLVAPAMLLIPHGREAFNEDGGLVQETHQAMLVKVVGSLMKLAMINPLLPKSRAPAPP